MLQAALPSRVSGSRPGSALVVKPDNASEVARVLRLCTETGTPVLPAGRHEPDGEAVVLDLSGLTQIHAIDENSLTVHAGSGIRVADLQMALRDRGYTLGFALVPHLSPKLGGFLSGQGWAEASVLFGKPWCAAIGIEGVLPTGRTFRIKPTPRRAVGPDLSELFLGAEGRLGVLTAAWVKFHPMARARAILAASLPGHGVALRSAARMVHDGLRPAFARIHELGLLPSPPDGAERTVLVVGFEGEARLVDVFLSMAVDLVKDRSGRILDEDHPLATRPIRSPCSRPELADHLSASVPWARAEELVQRVSRAFGDTLVAIRISDMLHEGCTVTWTARLDRSNSDRKVVKPLDQVLRAIQDGEATVIAHHGPFPAGHVATLQTDEVFGSALGRLAAILDPGEILHPEHRQ